MQAGQLDHLINSLAKFSKTQWLQAEANKIMVQQAREWGLELIFRNLWEKLGLHSILENLLAKTQIIAPIAEAIYAMVLNRISDPLSKRAASDWVTDIYRPAFDGLQLHHFYRALDFLSENKDIIELELFNNVRNIFNLHLDMVFWDSTSTYFEGNGPEIAAYGYSKDHRSDRLQIIIGVLMTREGIPVAHRIFPGNTSDIDTFKEIIQDTRKRFQLRRVIFIGDRGMVSPKLLDELDRQHIEYVVGMKMRRMKVIKQVLQTGGRYKVISDNLKVKEVLSENADRYIVCYNPIEAEHDRQAREKIVKKLAQRLAETGIKQMIGNSGYRRFLLIEGSRPKLNSKVIEEDALYDGKYILRANCPLNAEEAALAYKDLWRVERAFRDLKSTLDLRPVFHWKDQRVEGHVMVCFLALVLESALQRSLNQADSKVEYMYLIRDLKKLKAVELSLEGKKYLCRTELAGNAYEAFKVLGVRPPNYCVEI
jgi:transposase